MCYYTPRSACRNNAPLHESIMTTHAKGFGATSPVQPIPSQRWLNMQRVTCDSREARDIEFNPERERERNTLVFAYCNSSNLSRPHHATISLVRRAATLTFPLSRATVEPLVHCVSQTVKSPISQTRGATP